MIEINAGKLGFGWGKNRKKYLPNLPLIHGTAQNFLKTTTQQRNEYFSKGCEVKE